MKKIIQISLLALLMALYSFGELSKSQVKDVAEQYIEACINQDFDAWKSIYYKPDTCSRDIFDEHKGVRPRYSSQFPLKKASIRRVDELNAVIEFKGQYSRWSGWLQLLPSGKIKYDPLFYPHPIGEVMEACYTVNNNITLSRFKNTPMTDTSESIKTLLKSGIPTFGLKVDDSADNHLEAVRKISDWIDENLEKWDNTEPHVYFPGKP